MTAKRHLGHTWQVRARDLQAGDQLVDSGRLITAIVKDVNRLPDGVTVQIDFEDSDGRLQSINRPTDQQFAVAVG